MKKDFLWGVSTSATQIEGAAFEDGKGLSIWDIIPTRKSSGTFQGEDASVACDHYHRYKEDVALLKKLGVNCYRFSIAWTRILPDGTGKVNQKGIEFYSNLIDELLRNGIEPFVTIYHWDLPYALHNKGAYMNPEFPDWFAEYTKVIAENFAGKVKYFTTFNEPACLLNGVINRAKFSVKEKLTMIHNILLAHGKAAKILHGYEGVKVGIVPNSSPPIPKTESKEDIEAARKHYFRVEYDSIWGVSMYCDPIIFGKYPDEYFETYSKNELPDFHDGDFEIISEPIDFLGQNIYNGDYYVSSDKKGGCIVEQFSSTTPRTSSDWPVKEEGLYWGPKFLCERYHKPFIITENGCAVTDLLTSDKKVHDGASVEFLKRYITCYKKASEECPEIIGYFVWSFMDNFEWSSSYRKRYGLVYVDYETEERFPKDSFFYYSKVVKSNGEEL
ncbi:MAG: family 1 glycosylhydrolase [Firmicutes bacterium]|nr:family 1 glycosylhydrolase [Candidatus Caballimonas caccae]